MKRIYLFGGGCFGQLHVRNLLRARERDAIDFDRLTVIDRNPHTPVHERYQEHPDVEFVRMEWTEFVRDILTPEAIPPSDEIVLPPLGPHLTLHWVQARMATLPLTRVHTLPWSDSVGTPFEKTLATGMHAVSYALWRCPATCIEPAVCPGNGQLRNWEMPDFVRGHVGAWRIRGIAIDHAEIFISRHRAWGIATLPFASFQAAWDRLKERLTQGRPQVVLVATVSSCHGLLGLLRVEPVEPFARVPSPVASSGG